MTKLINVDLHSMVPFWKVLKKRFDNKIVTLIFVVVIVGSGLTWFRSCHIIHIIGYT